MSRKESVELAAKYHLAAGHHGSFERYMTEAVHCYTRWGAKKKVACLVKPNPRLLLQEVKNNVFAIPAGSGSVHSSEALDVTSGDNQSIPDHILRK